MTDHLTPAETRRTLLAAEAKLRAVEALADDLTRGDLDYPSGRGEGYAAQWAFEQAARRLRAVLASVPSGGVAPTEQAGEAKKRHLHSCFPSDCDHIADRCCIDCCEPGGWAEPAATPTAEAGEGK